MAADRAPFIDQSQAFSLYMVKANEENISNMHIFTWKLVSIHNFKTSIKKFLYFIIFLF